MRMMLARSDVIVILVDIKEITSKLHGGLPGWVT